MSTFADYEHLVETFRRASGLSHIEHPPELRDYERQLKAKVDELAAIPEGQRDKETGSRLGADIARLSYQIEQLRKGLVEKPPKLTE